MQISWCTRAAVVIALTPFSWSLRLDEGSSMMITLPLELSRGFPMELR